MYQLPLFPLDTVLFPNMPITLHIFEPRYKLMIEQCVQTEQPFGVVLIREGVGAWGTPAQPHSIGCTAEITDVERLSNGHMNIIAVGGERFRIQELAHDKPYLVGTVESYPLNHHGDPEVSWAGRQLRPWVERYLAVLSRAAENLAFDPASLPEDPLALGYLAAALLQIPSDQKQPLLATDHAATLLTDVRTIYRREVALMSAILERDRASDFEMGIFSIN